MELRKALSGTTRGLVVLMAASVIGGCTTSFLLSSVTEQNGLGAIVGAMQGEGGAIRMTPDGLNDPPWSICGDVIATELGGRSPTSTVSTNASGQFAFKVPAGSYRLTSSNTIECSFRGRSYSTPSCVTAASSPCHEATPPSVVVLVTAGRESHVTLEEIVP